MAGLASIIASGIKVADKITDSLQVTATLQSFIGYSSNGTGTELQYAAATNHKVIADIRRRQYRTAAGEMVDTIASVFFCRPIAPNGTLGVDRKEPIDTRDLLTLPDGTTGPIVGVEGLLDPSTNQPYYAIVWLGAKK